MCGEHRSSVGGERAIGKNGVDREQGLDPQGQRHIVAWHHSSSRQFLRSPGVDTLRHGALDQPESRCQDEQDEPEM